MISNRSGGGTPDALGYKLSGSLSVAPLLGEHLESDLDLDRGVEVEIVVRGIVKGHTFTDTTDKDGEVTTTKYVVTGLDELVAVRMIPRRSRRQAARPPRGQTALGEQGETRDAVRDEPLDVEREAGTPAEVLRRGRGRLTAERAAEMERELEEGLAAGGHEDVSVAIQTTQFADDDLVGDDLAQPGDSDGSPSELAQAEADSIDAAEEELDGAGPARDPMVPEAAWRELNLEQKGEVAEMVVKIHRLGAAWQEAGNPTDREAAQTKAKKIHATLLEDFGIELDVDAAEELEPPADEPAPTPVFADSPPMKAADLRKRRRYLEGQGGLPAEAARARAAELAEIDRRLRA